MITRIHVGSDIAKNWFDVHFVLAGKEFVQRHPNTKDGCRSFIEALQSLGAKKVHICMEYTGGYEMLLALACREAGFIVSLVDGSRIKHYRDSFSSTGASTDKKSAYLLARYCKERRPEVWFPIPDEYRILRDLVRHRERLLKCKLEWSCRAAHNSQDEVVQAQRNTLVELLALQVNAAQERIAEHVESSPVLTKQVQLLVTIPGIAVKSAYRILAEVGPIGNYACAKALALAAGLVPIAIRSGKSIVMDKLPVYGNRELRTALYFPVLVSKRLGKGVGPFVERVGAKNKSKMTAIVAGMRKLAHIIFGVLSTETPYNPELVM